MKRADQSAGVDIDTLSTRTWTLVLRDGHRYEVRRSWVFPNSVVEVRHAQFGDTSPSGSSFFKGSHWLRLAERE